MLATAALLLHMEMFESLEAKGYKPKMNVMDNQTTKYIKKFITKKECNLQLVEPHNHSVNAAERAIQTFKDTFIAVLATTDREFPLQLWDRLAPQVQDTLNLIRASRINPNILAYEALNGPYNWDGTHLRPQDAKQSFMKPRQFGDLGHRVGPMHGIWGHRQTTINATYTMCLKHARTEFQGQPNCFPNTAKYQI
jgi:hypothetical protein